jgi:hypothetical protein
MTGDVQRIAHEMRRYGPTAEPTLLDASGAVLASVTLPISDPDLPGATVRVGVRSGALVVEALEPAGHPMYRAIVNAAIEERLRVILRSLCCSGAVDGEGARVAARHAHVYPRIMPEWHPTPSGLRRLEEWRRRGPLMAVAGFLACLTTVALVLADLAHPVVILPVPGLAIWSWATLRRARSGGDVVQGASTHAEHVQRARAQAGSIDTAVNRARGLSH